ncbi:hypothetical protein ACWF94_26050 [Streptomyces sp. NPDC055078]
MSAYSRIYQALTRSGTPAPEAAADLAELRAEIGAELAAGLQAHATEAYAPTEADTRGVARLKKRRYAVASRAADWITQATATGRLTTTPNQHTRSTP